MVFKNKLIPGIVDPVKKDLMITANYIVDKIPSKLIDELGIKSLNRWLKQVVVLFQRKILEVLR